MHGAKEIVLEATSLPIEERAFVVDSLLRSMNPSDPDIDAAWVEVAKRRRAELRAGRVQAVPAEDVFAHIRERFGR
jgi:putative addiction module component (TIGR02574 family)